MTYTIEGFKVVPGTVDETRTLADLERDINRDRIAPEISRMFEIGRIIFIYDDNDKLEAILASDEETLSEVKSLLGI